MAKVSVIAKIPAAPGKREELKGALQSLLDGAQGEAGTELYILSEDPNDADVLYMYEQYSDQSALEVHMGSEVFKSAGPALGPFLGGRPELTFLSVVGGKGA